MGDRCYEILSMRLRSPSLCLQQNRPDCTTLAFLLRDYDFCLKSTKHPDICRGITPGECLTRSSYKNPESEEECEIPEQIFSWTAVPGPHDQKLRTYLKKEFGLDWVETTEITKTDDGEAISISSGGNWAEIRLYSDHENATLNISDGRTADLIAKVHVGDLYIDAPFSFRNICLAYLTKDESYCADLSQGSKQYACFTDLALVKHDRSICDRIGPGSDGGMGYGMTFSTQDCYHVYDLAQQKDSIPPDG